MEVSLMRKMRGAIKHRIEKEKMRFRDVQVGNEGEFVVRSTKQESM
jgi:hypothetical protein